MKKPEPHYDSNHHLIIPPAYTGARLEKWLDRNRVKLKHKTLTKSEQVMKARINSGAISDTWCYAFIESRLEKRDIIKTLPSSDTLKAARILMRIFHIMAGKDSGKVFEKAVARGDLEKAMSITSSFNEKLIPIYFQAVREMRIEIV